MKKTMQDMLPPDEGDKKSIRNIPVPDRTFRSKFASKKNAPQKEDVESSLSETSDVITQAPEEESAPKVGVGTIIDVRDLSTEELKSGKRNQDLTNFVVTGHAAQYKKRRKIKIAITTLLIIVFVFLGIGTTSLFSSATIEIVRHSIERDFSNEIVSISYGTTDSVAQVIDVQVELGSQVTATEEEYVETKSSGNIVVYNDHSTSPQKLIKNTRFESPDGNIYRIQDSVVVPGQSSSGKETIPGSIEVTVYADEPGESFNTDLTDFTIPGFKSDTERYKNFYARSKTKIAGGFKGTVKKISDTDLETAKESLRSQIDIEILKEAEKNIPETFTFFSSLGKIQYENLPQSDADETSVKINMKGTMSLPIFKTNELQEVLGGHFEDEFVTGEKPYVYNLSDLSVDYAQETVLEESGEINLLINGLTDTYWRLDVNRIKLDLAGEKRDSIEDANGVLSKYKTINAAKAFVKPFWKNSFPADVNDIEIQFVDSI